MYDIKVRNFGSGDVRIELRGEFDLYALDELREALGNMLSLRRPTVVDLSEIVFLDMQCIRELAVVSQLYAHHLTVIDPSWQARASVKACGLAEQVHFKGFYDFYEGRRKDSCKGSFLEVSRNTNEHSKNQV